MMKSWMGGALGILSALALSAGDLSAAPHSATVIVDISGIGAERLAELKQDPAVLWSAEFGTEMLLGVKAVEPWLKRPGVRAGLGSLAPEEIWVRDHVCVHQAQQPALGVVGGYEVLRQPPAAIRAAKQLGLIGVALPEDGVIAREHANLPAAEKAAPMATRGVVADLVARVDAERWFTTMSTLAGYNRNSFSAALPSARNWVLTQFANAGLSTSTFEFQLANLNNCGASVPPPITIDNPVGRKQGVQLPDEWIVIGAHYDSRNSVRCDGTANPQPGANDNASGCAGVIELARVFQGVETARSVLFMCFSGEEQGLWGSRRYVEALQASGDIGKVKHMINLDMLGFDSGGTLDARVESNATHAAWLQQYVAAAATYAPELNIITSSNTGGGSDHWYFLSAGVPAVFTWENGAAIYPHYHQSTDIPANMTRARELAGGILKMDTAMLSTLAGLSVLHEDGFE